jgi:hypothetical protein
VKAGDLHRFHIKRRSIRPSEADSLIASRLVYAGKMVRSKGGEVMEVEVSKICVSFAGYLTESLFGVPQTTIAQKRKRENAGNFEN